MPRLTCRGIAILIAALTLAPCWTAPARAAGALSKVYGAALQGDMASALAILDSIDVSKLSPKDSTARDCLKRTFGNLPVHEDLPAKSGQILDAYRTYWQTAMLRRATQAEAERTLLATLRSVLAIAPADTAGLDDVSERARLAIGKEGLFALTGVTLPYYELMIWRTQQPTTYHVKLPERTIQVHVVFLDDFVSLGWAGYATCGRAHSGGWATQDSLFALKSAYDLESENFRVSYLAHEGRHFSDYSRYPKLKQPELEYRAKLTELAMSDTTTYSLIAAFSGLTGQDREVPHSFANYWVAKDMSRVVFGSDQLVDDAAKWRSVPADRIRKGARRVLQENDQKLKKLGSRTVEQFLVSSAN